MKQLINSAEKIMNTAFWQRLSKTENIILGIVLYGIVMVYTYQYSKIANKYVLIDEDEIFYYMEAKAISAHNIYQSPISYHGNNSIIGAFGPHGFSYAVKNGWLAKIFFHAQDPPLLLINFLTFLITLTLILIFKPFSINTRLKIALIVATHNVLYSYTLSYMQETIQFLFAVLAVSALYLLYQTPKPKLNSPEGRNYQLLNHVTGFIHQLITNLKMNAGRFYSYFKRTVNLQVRRSSPPHGAGSERLLASFLIVIIIAITFRYSWFIWGLGLLPLASNLKNFTKWLLIVIGLMAFGLFIGHYLCAPYPKADLAGYNLVTGESFLILNSLTIIWQKFTQNLQVFLTPDKSLILTCMRYLLLVLLIINSVFAIVKRNRFTIACTLIGWSYFIACLALYYIFGQTDQRILALLNPLLAFSLIGSSNSFIFYPIIAIQLMLFPKVIEERNDSYNRSITAIDPPDIRISREASYSKIKDLITDDDHDNDAVIVLPMRFVYFARNYIVNFPLVTKEGNNIHYYSKMVSGNDRRNTHHPNYIFADKEIENSSNQLIYSDRWMYLYRILN